MKCIAAYESMILVLRKSTCAIDLWAELGASFMEHHFYMKEWLKNYSNSSLGIWKIFSWKRRKCFKEKIWQYWLSIINFKFLSATISLLASQDFSSKMGDDFNKCHSFIFIMKCINICKICRVKQYFPNDLYTL